MMNGISGSRGVALSGAMVAMLLVALPAAARADSRVRRPLQLQLDLYGLHAGYHFSERFYLGVTRQFGSAVNRFHGGPMTDGAGHHHDGHDDGEAGRYGQEGVVNDDFDYGDRTAIELRFTPDPIGVYLAVGMLFARADRERVVWEQRQRTVGTGSYVTGLAADIEGRDDAVPAAGAGLNHVFSGGLSLTAGFLLGTRELRTPEVTVSATNPAVSDADLDRFRRKIRRDFNDPPLMVHMAVGYNF